MLWASLALLAAGPLDPGRSQEQRGQCRLTSTVVASSTAASTSVLEASSVAARGTSVVIALEAATTPSAPEATTTSVVKALLGGRPGLAALLVVLPHQLVSFLPLQLDEQNLIQEVPNVRQSEVG